MDDAAVKRWVKGRYQRGIPSTRIGPVLGLSRGQVQRVLWSTKVYVRRPWTDAERALVCQLWAAGATLDQIGEVSGRGRSAVYRVVRAARLARRPAPPSPEALKSASASFAALRDRRSA